MIRKKAPGQYVSEMDGLPGQLVMEEVTDPAELARAKAQDERFRRNTDWLPAHGDEIYPRYRDKFICVAGQELFVGETPREALDLAIAAHPDDDGGFLYYIPGEKLARIYAACR
ncbi:MAG: hypothetical protein ACRDHG_04060 [Anaerolineales bacterium]